MMKRLQFISFINERIDDMKTVLVADDNEDLRHIFVRAFDSKLFDVHQAKDGAEALHYIQQTPPDIIILDIDMPKLSGLEVLKYLKDNHYHSKVILVTGNSMMADVPQANDADLVLVKPVSIKELVTFVSRFTNE
jgi:two-component system cell cycle response regulator DivK